MAQLGGLVQALYLWGMPSQGLRPPRQGGRPSCGRGTRVGSGQIPGPTDPKRVDGGLPRFIAGVGVEQHLHFVLQAAQVLGRR